MPEKPIAPRKLSDKNTKQELLDAYQALAQQLEQKRAAELNPERQLQEKKADESIKTATTLAPEGIDREIGSLKSDIGRMLAEQTGLPVDFQIQRMTEANETYQGERNPLGAGHRHYAGRGDATPFLARHSESALSPPEDQKP